VCDWGGKVDHQTRNRGWWQVDVEAVRTSQRHS